MQQSVDVLVIGAGTAGCTLALACRRGGRQVAVVDDQPYGLRGCEPEQFLAAAAEVAQLSRQMSEIGVHPPAHLDWPALTRSASAFTGALPERTERGLEAAGIQLFFGAARFVSPEEVAIGGDTTVRAGAFVIATGDRAAPLDFPGAELAVSSSDFLELPTLPRRILFIGGGRRALSLGYLARAAGAAVTILEKGERVLKRFDAELVERMARGAKEAGISIFPGITASMAEQLRGALVTYGKAGCTEAFQSDLVVNTSGRVADLQDLDLQAGGVASDGDGVSVNEFLQSVSNPRVWALGGAVPGREAEVAADNILKGNHRRPDYRVIPSMVFSQPPLASVGLTEQQALEAGLRFKVNRGVMDDWPSSRRIGQKHAFYKVLIDDSGRIVGGHIFGHNAGGTVNIFALAMQCGLSTSELAKLPWAYPTDACDLKEMIS